MLYVRIHGFCGRTTRYPFHKTVDRVDILSLSMSIFSLQNAIEKFLNKKSLRYAIFKILFHIQVNISGLDS